MPLGVPWAEGGGVAEGALLAARHIGTSSAAPAAGAEGVGGHRAGWGADKQHGKGRSARGTGSGDGDIFQQLPVQSVGRVLLYSLPLWIWLPCLAACCPSVLAAAPVRGVARSLLGAGG